MAIVKSEKIEIEIQKQVMADAGCKYMVLVKSENNNKNKLKLSCFLKGFPHPSGANARKNIQFKENKRNMKLLLRNR